MISLSPLVRLNMPKSGDPGPGQRDDPEGDGEDAAQDQERAE
jgi:hypothetical protein